MFAQANQAEIIRSNQKDEYYVNFIKNSSTDLIQRLFGPRAWLKWRKEVDLLASLGYFGLTTFAGLQTLGEEYVNIVQVDDTLRTLSSRWQRGVMIVLQVTAPYLIDQLLSQLEKQIRTDPHNTLTPEAKTAFLNTIPVIRHTVTFIHRCHLTLFYMKGIFYQIAKRLTTVHYIRVREAGSSSAVSSYRILGWLSIIQLAVTFTRQVYSWSNQRKAADPSTTELINTLTAGNTASLSTRKDVKDSSFDPSLKCVLCLGQRTKTTATPCGHMFCWSCIMEWCSNKPECPLCRETFQMSRLVCLQNYDPL